MKDAEELGRLFPAVYLRLHARLPKRGHRPPADAMAVLQHLAIAGPLTVGEAARHFDRAQSVASDLIDRLVSEDLVARIRDDRDRRRVLVWLTPAGQAMLERDREVLSADLCSAAMKKMAPRDRRALLDGMRALIAAADEVAKERKAK
jgi:DNA-binding MarR family transcriptional regulator